MSSLMENHEVDVAPEMSQNPSFKTYIASPPKVLS